MNLPVLALIPARSGSKRVPLKNFKPLNGISLVDRAIQQALDSGCAEQVVVSTDRPELVKAPAAVIVHKREPLAASDTATAWDVIEDALRAFPESETVIYLQPTSPGRSASDISRALDLFRRGSFDSVISVSPSPAEALFSLTAGADQTAKFLFPEFLSTRTQELPAVYKLNGAIYISSKANLQRTRSFTSGKVGVFVMDANRSLDIDSMDDWQEAEKL